MKIKDIHNEMSMPEKYGDSNDYKRTVLNKITTQYILSLTINLRLSY